VFNLNPMAHAGGRIQCGTQSFNKEHPGYMLHKGTGSRYLSIHIHFPSLFSFKPAVIPMISGFDIVSEDETDMRLNTSTENASTSGFELKLGCWSGKH